MPKILVIRLSSMGDIVLTTPVVRCLKKQVAGAEIHFLVKEAYAGVLAGNPYIDRIFTLGRDDAAVMAALSAERYDHLVDLHHNLRTAAIRRKLGVKASAFSKLNFEKWLLVNFHVDRMPALHLVDRYLDTIRPLGVENDGGGLDFFIPGDLHVPVTLPERYVAFVIGGRHATKMLPVDQVVEVIGGLRLPAVLVGGPEDRVAGEEVRARCMPWDGTVARGVVNTCGALSLQESAAVVRGAQAVVTNDTGMMHVAAAFHRPIVSVWGSTVPAFGMAPYFGDGGGSDTRMEVTGLGCRPCSKIGFAECPRGHFRCMKRQEVSRIAAAVNALVS